MADLLSRLRDAHANSQQRVLGSDIFAEAAAEIERLTRERDEARAARLSDFTDAEISIEQHHRTMRRLGDQRLGVGATYEQKGTGNE